MVKIILLAAIFLPKLNLFTYLSFNHKVYCVSRNFGRFFTINSFRNKQLMNFNLVSAYRICVILLLLYISVQLYILKNELNDGLREIDMVVSKLDYVESDINSKK